MADSTHNNESTSTTPSPDQDRQITPENDPRHFHRRPMPATVEDAPEEEPQPDRSAAATETESQQPTEATTSNTETPNANENNDLNDARPQTEANGTSTTTQTSDEANTEAPRSGSRPTNTQHFEIRFIFPPVTFFTTVISEPLAPQSQQQPAGSQPNGQAQSTEQSNEQPNNQQSNASNSSTNGSTPNSSTASGPPPITFFGLHFFTPTPPHVHTAPASNATTNTTQTEGTAQQQPQSNGEQPQASEQQQPQQGPQPATQGQPSPFGSGPVPPGLMNAFLSAILSPFGNLNFVNDGVYSQEAFDRIITQLREQHAAQNPGGAPPASQAAIEKLRVKDIDEQMLQGCQDNKTKCVICVDDMTLGDKATLLPCNHFFHGECVTPWLKVHNTCPVCRRSVEVEEAPESKKRKNMAEHEPTGRDGHGIDEAAEDEDGQQSAATATPAIPERQRRPYGPERLRGEGTDCA